MAEQHLHSKSSKGSRSKEAAITYQRVAKNAILNGQTLVSIAGVVKGEKVLDLGCGTGHFAAVLSDLVGPEGRVVAVDPDQERITIATESYGRPNIEYLVADDQTFPGEDYNLVFSNYVIHRIQDKAAMFKRMYEKLCPGGRIAILTFAGMPHFPQEIVNFLAEFTGPNFYQTLMYEQQMFETADTYQTLAEAAGFTVKVTNIKQSTAHWDDIENVVSCFYGISHGLMDLSKVDESVLQRYKEKKKPYEATYNLFYMVATKQN